MSETQTKPKRRWYQFSLRTLLIVITLSALPLGWVGSKLAQRRREQPVIAWVEKLEGTVRFEGGEDSSWWEWAAAGFGQNVKGVNLDGTQVSDLSPLAKLKNLEWLNLNNTQVSDLSPLAELKNLELLILTDMPVSDLSPLAELKSLEMLYLSHTPVSDLSPLAELKSLQRLTLNDTQVNDLSPLAELKNLERLFLKNTQVSDEQVQKLQRALPDCSIVPEVDEP